MMAPLAGPLVLLLLTVNCYEHLASPVYPATVRPLVLFHKLLTGQSASPVDRRKAVTIGGNRWLRSFTFQVPDVISNLIPSSSNIIKVHDDTKNKTNVPNSEAKPVAMEQQPQYNPMMGYDPLQLITNFDQSAFLKGMPSNPMASFAYPNSTFAFDESQLSNVQAPMFAGMAMPQLPPSLAMQLNADKPFATVPMFEPDPNYPSQDNRLKKAPFYPNEFYNQNSDESVDPNPHHEHMHNHPHSNHHRPYPTNDEQQQQKAPSFGEHMAESYQGKENMFKSPGPMNYQGDYYPREHHRLPESGSGNYDYSRTSFGSEPNRDTYFGSSAMADHGADSSERANFAYKKPPLAASYGFANDFDKDSERSNSMKPYFQKEIDPSSTERPLYRDYGPSGNGNSGNANDSKFGSNSAEQQQSGISDYFSQGGGHFPKTSENGMGSSKGNEPSASSFDAERLKMEPSEVGNYGSYYNTGFQSAASVLNPVVVKGDMPGSEERSTAQEKGAALASGVNLYQNAQLKSIMARPAVASRIKEFFKSMLTQQKY